MSTKIICCCCGNNQDVTGEVYQDIYFPNRMVRNKSNDMVIICKLCGDNGDMIIFGEASFNLLGKEKISYADKQQAKLSNVIFHNKCILELEKKLLKENATSKPYIRKLEYDVRYHREALIINQNC